MDKHKGRSFTEMVMRHTRFSYVFLVITLLTLSAARTWAQESAQTWRTTEERWYVMEMFGTKAGWVSTITQTDGMLLRTITDTSIKLNRGSVPIEVSLTSTFTETKDGKPVSAAFKQMMSRQAIDTSWEFVDGKVKTTTKQGGREVKDEQPAPEGEWLTPQAADRFARQQRQAGAESFTWRALDPQNGVRVITFTAKRTGSGTFERDGKTRQVSIWNMSNDLVPIESVEHVDEELGTMVYQETNMMGMGKMITRLSSKEDAMGGPAAAQMPEVLVQTFITPDKPIENPMKAVRAKLRLTMKEGKMPELPSAGAQRAEMAADGKAAILTIDINDNLPASAADVENKEYRAASAMIDSNDELIQKLAKRAAAREEGEAESADGIMRRAEALRRLARKHISKKGMETAFASASETAKMRTGDCSEHGVLLAALLRADGIPARVATGLVYADAFAGHEGIFGWHMWTQALIDGKWVDFDATLPVRYNAAHVLTSTSSLSDGLMTTDMASIIQLIGNLNIEVLAVEYASD